MPRSILYSKVDQVIFFKLANSSKNSTVLWISPYELKIRIVDASQFPEKGEICKVAGLLGIIRLKKERYVIIANKVEEVGVLNGHIIYKVKSHSIFSVNEAYKPDSDEREYLSLLNAHLNRAMLYFSYTYDLTNSMQRNEKHNTLSWENSDARFFWNYYVTEELRKLASSFGSVNDFIIPMIYGYAKMITTSFKNVPITLGLITRRSRIRAGTRYFRRGVDDMGHVANFNETEQILLIQKPLTNQIQVFSFIQTRGSVPVFWSEVNNLKYKPNIMLGENGSFDAFQKHFNEQKEIYGVNYLVNLLNQQGHELPVKEAYETAVNGSNDSKIRYLYFDFHHECRRMRWHRARLLIDQLEKLGLSNSDVFSKTLRVNGSTEVVSSTQSSVVRTNCMDCLDRTNVVQSLLAKWVMQRHFEVASLASIGDEWENDKELLSHFQNLWADNADCISLAYSGTSALKTDFTRTGRRTYIGALKDLLNSIFRYYQNNFADGPIQDNFDIFLGNFKPYDSTIEFPFLDMRPMLIQVAPIVLYAALTVLTATIFFPRGYFFKMNNFGYFVGSSIATTLLLRFIMKHGMQYVNWPRLTDLGFLIAVQSYNKEQFFRGVTYIPSSKFIKPNVLKRD